MFNLEMVFFFGFFTQLIKSVNVYGVISPVQLDLETIKDMYLEKFDVTLKDALSSDCGGDFKRLLLAILH